MILTVTANPSIDHTVELAAPLEPGAVHRAVGTRIEPGGKGINVARVVATAGVDTLALLPAHDGDPLLRLLDDVGLRYQTVTVDAEVRTNITVADPSGTTTKLNAAGAPLSTVAGTEFIACIEHLAPQQRWIALCGSLPPGVPDDWYATLVDHLVGADVPIAVDTSGAPLLAVARPGVALLKPNADELAELVGGDGAEIEAAAAAGDYGPAATASNRLAERTGGAVLTTLGAAGALLTVGARCWAATVPPIAPRSTVGAGDASLAGYLLADVAGASAPDRLRRAVAYGSAAAALPGTQPPHPDQLNLTDIRVTELSPSPR